jgi:hypothetical protein
VREVRRSGHKTAIQGLAITAAAVTHVPTSATNAAGRGSGQVVSRPQAAPGTLLTADGKPVDFGNKYISIGASYDPSVLSGLSWTQIAADLSKPHTKVAEAVDGTANYITAALCKLTRNQPATACTATIRSLEPSLSSKHLCRRARQDQPRTG